MAEIKTVKMATPDSSSTDVLCLTNFSGHGYRMVDLVTETGGEYTFSVWAKAESAMQVVFRVLGGLFTKDISTEWERIVINVSNSTETYLEIQPNNDTALYFYKGMLQKGHYDTDWKPAPEDTAGQIASVESKLELCVKKDENDQIVSMINASANQIALKSNRLTIDSDNFTLASDGTMTATAGEIAGFKLKTDKVSGLTQHSLLGGHEANGKTYGLRLLPQSGTDEWDSSISFTNGSATVTLTAVRTETGEGFLEFLVYGAPVHAANGLQIGNDTVADFVVVQGTSGSWMYRKWMSGLYECWGIFSAGYLNANVLDLWLALPITFTKNIYVGASLMNIQNYSTWLNENVKAMFSDEKTVRVCVNLPGGDYTSTSKSSVSVYVVGRWK